VANALVGVPAKPRLVWSAIKRVVPGSTLSRILNAAVLWVIVMALSNNFLLASVVSLAEVALRPILDRLVSLAWLGGLSPSWHA